MGGSRAHDIRVGDVDVDVMVSGRSCEEIVGEEITVDIKNDG